MKLVVFTLLAVFVSNTCFAQNKVINGDFETYSSCPQGYSYLHYSNGWISPNWATPDYFNTCDTSNYVGIPKNRLGIQDALSGYGYGGIVSYQLGQPWCEYLAREITQLVAGETYQVSISISLAGQSNYAIKGLGVYFYEKGIGCDTSHYRKLDVIPQIDFTPYGVIADTTNWITLVDTFTADSAFKNIVVGRFTEISNSDITFIGLNSPSFNLGYYYIDNVIVRNVNKEDLNMPDLYMTCTSSVVASAGKFDSFLWSNESTDSTIEIKTPGDYWVMVTDISGTYTDTFSVQISDVGSYGFSVPDSIIYCKESLVVRPGDFEQYLWSTGSTNDSLYVDQPGMYWVTIKNYCGYFTDTFNVVDGGCFFIPNVFTPNKDGSNETFGPRRIELAKNYSFHVFNRYGQVVFYSEDPLADWDGTFKGENCDLGTYYWLLKYSSTREKIEKKGSVTLLR